MRERKRCLRSSAIKTLHSQRLKAVVNRYTEKKEPEPYPGGLTDEQWEETALLCTGCTAARGAIETTLPNLNKLLSVVRIRWGRSLPVTLVFQGLQAFST